MLNLSPETTVMFNGESLNALLLKSGPMDGETNKKILILSWQRAEEEAFS